MKQITFIDEAKIKVKGGNGGDGVARWRREKYIDKGGPFGGSGGNGGAIIFIASKDENTLLNFKGHSLFKAENGGNGGNQNMTGRQGKATKIIVPVGTEIYVNNKKIADLNYDGKSAILAKGGKGGRGNLSFKSAQSTAPNMFERGEQTDWVNITLNLKLLADVGLLGYPNVGKSTFLAANSNSKPKIANYEFTTLTPNLGVVTTKGKKFVITDLPGLIDGASNNKGMGIQFLKHLSRTKLIIHLLDLNREIKTDYKNLRKELSNYSEQIAKLPEIIVINKIDLFTKEEISKKVTAFKRSVKSDNKIFLISAKEKLGLIELVDFIALKLDEIKIYNLEAQNEYLKFYEYEFSDKEKDLDELKINYQNGVWTIDNNYVKYWARRISIENDENLTRIVSKLKSKGYFKQLEDKGIKSGEMIVIKDTDFIFEYQG